jgi:hypothetical protein
MPNSMRHGDRGCDTVLAGYSGWHLIRPRRAAITMRLPFGPKGIRANQTNRHKLGIARGLAALQISVLRPRRAKSASVTRDAAQSIDLLDQLLPILAGLLQQSAAQPIPP